MSSKIFLIIAVILVQAIFAGLNIKNVSDISIGFTVLNDIPVFLTIAVSFIAGAVLVLPFAYYAGRKNRKLAEEKKDKKTKVNKSKKDDAEKKDNII